MDQKNGQEAISNNKGKGNTEKKNTLVPSQATISKLRKTITGHLILPEDPEYEQARVIFLGGYNRHPAMIIQAADDDDVANAVTLAGETGMELAVRSGGHSPAGHSSSEGGLVLDLRDMKALRIDPESRTAWAEAGLTAGEYTTTADAHGLATGFGDTGSVGIGGLTLGGGIGYLSRKHGLTIDNLLAAKIVTADGKLLHVDTESHPDLFWAIRGGGGNFGVATRFQFQLHEVGQVFGGMLLLPATPEVITGFIGEAISARDELSTIANVMPAPPMPFLPAELHGKLTVMAMMVYAGSIEAGISAIAPFRKLAQPWADMLRPMRYPEMFP
ncbi:MAG TPA: FAD-dependent oxidoreductase, partial [Anaerolineales bacterium]